MTPFDPFLQLRWADVITGTTQVPNLLADNPDLARVMLTDPAIRHRLNLKNDHSIDELCEARLMEHALGTEGIDNYNKAKVRAATNLEYGNHILKVVDAVSRAASGIKVATTPVTLQELAAQQQEEAAAQ